MGAPAKRQADGEKEREREGEGGDGEREKGQYTVFVELSNEREKARFLLGTALVVSGILTSIALQRIASHQH